MEEGNKNPVKCCETSCGDALGADFWNKQYEDNSTGWDLGEVSPPLKEYIDQLKEKDIRILIPGCGNTYEAAYLLKNGFTNITVIDIAPALVDELKKRFVGNNNIRILPGDFFKHQDNYDVILEQTFFCALSPSLRKDYVAKMSSLILPKGKLAGVLFNRQFEQQGPPFGGSKDEYELLFRQDFNLRVFEKCYNSFIKRMDTELFMILQKK